MRKDILSAFAALALLATSAHAGVKNCNNALVTQGVCGDNTHDVIYLRLAGESRQQVVTSLAKRARWTANVTCTQEMVDVATCSVDQIGASVPNPESKANAASRYLREHIKAIVREEKLQEIRDNGVASLPPAEVTD